MKHFIFFSLLILLYSCNKSDRNALTFGADTQSFEKAIQGDWNVNSFVINSCPDPSENLSKIFADENGCFPDDFAMGCMNLRFVEDGILEVRENGVGDSDEDVEHLTYELDPENNLITFCDGEVDSFCVDLLYRNGCLINEMDEAGCLCVLSFTR